MPAHEHINSRQLQLFASGTELRSKIINESGDREPGKGSYEQITPAPGGAKIERVPGTPRESMDSMWARKSAEAKSDRIGWVHGAGVHESIATEGWRGSRLTIIHTDTPDGGVQRRLSDGHHRVAAVADLEGEGKGPMWIPLSHAEYSPHRAL